MMTNLTFLVLTFGQPTSTPVDLVHTFDRRGSRLVKNACRIFFMPNGDELLLQTWALGDNVQIVSLKDGKDGPELLSKLKGWNGNYLVEEGKVLVRFRDNLRPEIVPTTEFWDLTTLKKTKDVELHLTHGAADGSIFGGPDRLMQRIREKDNPEIYFYKKGKWWQPYFAIKPEGSEKGRGPVLLTISNDGALAATAERGSITIWDLNEKKKVKTLEKIPGYTETGPCYPIVEARFTPDAKSLVVSGGSPRPIEEETPVANRNSMSVWLFDLKEGKSANIAVERYGYRTVKHIHFISETTFVAAEQRDPRSNGFARIVAYDLKNNRLLPLLDSRKIEGNSILAFGAVLDGKRIAIVNGMLDVQVYELKLPKEKD